MKMFRSISCQLQFSYGMLVVLALFGAAIFGYLMRKSEMLREVDQGLLSRNKRMTTVLVRYEIEGRGLAGRALEENRQNPGTVTALPRPSGTIPPLDNEAVRYYRIWKMDGDELRLLFQSENAKDNQVAIPLPDEIPRTGIARMNGNFRERLSRAQRDYVILVGTDLSEPKQRLNEFLVRMILIELAVLGIFIGAGFYLTKRALRPIGKISETARTIADGALDERISNDVGGSELAGLSSVLNESFDKLEGSIRRQQHFVSNASHELRTPITVILTEGQSRPKTIDDYRKCLDNCANAARSMGQLVEQLLELARFDSKDIDSNTELTDLDLLVSESVKMIRATAGQKSISIETELDLIQAEVNPVRINQILVNLLSNAISYTPEHGKIKVRLSEDDQAIRLEVEDNGVGISDEDLPNLFNRFYRADKARADHEKNHFGLGLAISREIAIAHGGELEVTSELGKGSTFTLKLPKTGPEI